MDHFQRAQSSRRMLAAILRADSHIRYRRPAFPPTQLLSSSSSSSRATQRRDATTDSASGSKPIVLEQPDKFRPPSHPQRLMRQRPRASYNQGTTEPERQAQETRTYPHMFPRQGTKMHWFLTDRKVHAWITLGVLFSLALFSLMQTFMHNSPYAHLMPPWSSIVSHPLRFFSEAWSVYRLHLEYTTAQAAEGRQQLILDAQKRRLYRRAHGMENLDVEEDQGVDVTGLVPWDDGLTNVERAKGGRARRVTGQMVVDMGGEVGEDISEFMKKRNAQMSEKKRAEEAGEAVEMPQGESEVEVPQKRKRKLFFGIW